MSKGCPRSVGNVPREGVRGYAAFGSGRRLTAGGCECAGRRALGLPLARGVPWKGVLRAGLEPALPRPVLILPP